MKRMRADRMQDLEDPKRRMLQGAEGAQCGRSCAAAALHATPAFLPWWCRGGTASWATRCLPATRRRGRR